MTGVRQTSLDAYWGLKDLGEKQKTVLDKIKELGSACNLDLAYALSWPINRVTPRTNELVEMGYVEEAKRAITPRTGRKVIYWRAKS